jgi:hypothetical protein
MAFTGFIDVEVVNDPDPAANTPVPAEFAGFFAVEGFIGFLDLNKIDLTRNCILRDGQISGCFDIRSE